MAAALGHDKRAAAWAETAAGGIAAVGFCHVVTEMTSKAHFGRPKHHHAGVARACNALTIAALAVQAQFWYSRPFVANCTAGTATCIYLRHRPLREFEPGTGCHRWFHGARLTATIPIRWH